MNRRILITALAIVYGAIVLPGHSGLHWLSGIEHCSSHVPSAAQSACTPASKTESTARTGCGHSHAHQHSNTDGHTHGHTHQTDGEHPSQQPDHTPHQDHSDCEICQWFSQGQLLISSTLVEASESAPETSLPTFVEPIEKSVFSIADPRGPPAV